VPAIARYPQLGFSDILLNAVADRQGELVNLAAEVTRQLKSKP
jgi:hypothetical protein